MPALIDPLKSSEFLPALRAADRLRFRVRPLQQEEVRRLVDQGCSSDDWTRIRVAESFRPDRVREVRFKGDVTLGRCFGRVRFDDWDEPSQLLRTTIEDCRIDDGAVIRDVGVVARMRIGAGVALVQCGAVVHPEGGNFGIGTPVAVVETGGRVTRTFPEMTVEIASRTLLPGGDTLGLAAFLRRVEAYSARARSRYGVVGAGARVLCTSRLSNIFLGSGARVEGAVALTDSVLLCDPVHPAVVEKGSFVDRSILQRGSRVSSLAFVDHSVLCEHSLVEKHARVSQSVIGPNAHIGQGEVTSSLVGPFVGMHHASLLIGTAWPEGKGNVAAGCLCGSNHTGRSPDQEFWPGEGMFLGLGVQVKFPGCFQDAPYSLIASGVRLPPQCVSLPFSLICEPQFPPEGLPAGMNEILPGWVLGHNLFSLRRSERKFLDRDRTSGGKLETRVFRPDVVEHMLRGRRRLQSLSGRDWYTERELPEIGKNFLTETNRLRGIDDYTFHIQLFALDSVARRLLAEGSLRRSLFTRKSRSAAWEFVRSILIQENLPLDPPKLIRLYLERSRMSLDAVVASKARDDVRGAAIIPDYADHHLPATENSFIRTLLEEHDRMEDALADLLEACVDD